MSWQPANSRYTLKAHTSGVGALDPRTAILLWVGGSILLGLTVSYLLVQGNFRTIVLLLLGFLGLACLAPRRGVYILLCFLPFMYFIRRLVLNFQTFLQRDPILIFPVLTTLAMFLGVVIFYSPTVFHYLKRSALFKACVILMIWFAGEIFNLLQGSILIGLAGGMFFLIPMAWTFFGILMSREDMRRILNIVLVIGFIVSLYGLHQHYFGMSDAEVYELRAKEQFKEFGDDQVRIMSTFAGLGDFSRYLSITSFLAFAYFWRDRRRISLLLVLGISVFTMLWVAVRTSFLVMLFSILMLLVVSGPSKRRIAVRSAGSVLCILLLYWGFYQQDPTKMYDYEFSQDPFVVHTLSGITHPTQETSFQARLQNWRYIVTSSLWPYPLGRGVGATTPAARKFSGGDPFSADSYFFELFYGSGIPAPIIFGIVMFLFLRNLLRLSLAFPDEPLYRICFGLMSGFCLGSVFGGAARDTVSGPLMWLVLGWTVRMSVDSADHDDRGRTEDDARRRLTAVSAS